jgi:hypothetical protein
MAESWDIVVIGAGTAGAATALGALSVRPGLRVLLLDRAAFPRDKACGDGIAPHVLDVLASVGVMGLLDDWTPCTGSTCRTATRGCRGRCGGPRGWCRARSSTSDWSTPLSAVAPSFASTGCGRCGPPPVV